MEIHVYLAVYFKYCESLSEKLKREQSEWIAKAIEKVTGIYDPDMSSMEPANPAKKLLDCVENGLRGEDSIAKRTMDDFCTILRSCSSCYDLITTRMRQDCRGGALDEHHLRVLRMKLRPVWPNWEHFAEHELIGVPIYTQECFQVAHPRDPEKCFRDVLIYWLKHSCCPTWYDVILVLKGIDMDILARNLEEEFYPKIVEPKDEYYSSKAIKDTGMVSTSTLQEIKQNVQAISKHLQAISHAVEVAQCQMDAKYQESATPLN